NSLVSSLISRPDRTSCTIWYRNSGVYLLPLFDILNTSLCDSDVSTKAGQVQYPRILQPCLSFVVAKDVEGAHCGPGDSEPDWKVAQGRGDARRGCCPLGGGNSTRRSNLLHPRQHLSALFAGSVVRKEIQAADPG